jgi:hypothetical protein
LVHLFLSPSGLGFSASIWKASSAFHPLNDGFEKTFQAEVRWLKRTMGFAALELEEKGLAALSQPALARKECQKISNRSAFPPVPRRILLRGGLGAQNS